MPDDSHDIRTPYGATSTTVDIGGPVHAWVRPGPGAGTEEVATVLCLHGLGGSALNFGPVTPLLAERHRVVALDLLGHGGTRSGRPELSASAAVEEQLDLVATYVATRVDEPVVLVGHSLGGVLAVLHTLAYPETVDRLVLLAPPVPHRTDAARDRGLAAKRAVLGTSLVRGLVDRQLRRTAPADLVVRQVAEATPHTDRVPAAALAASVAEQEVRASAPDAAAARRTQWNAILGTIDLLARPLEWRDRLAEVAVPTLWLQGHDDLKVPLDDATRLATSVRAHASVPERWDFRTRAGVGHLLHMEDAAWTADALLGWLGARA
ncbi:alpha/beta hydrolase [Nocardioides sp. zg-1308]|uniref:alpha/beta fold hydrolase n=1 Tax=Nocardioides sp. zg-1308 TaxID=2736253 RepID=UPI001556DBAD|nr:alpha/beta hydrolase [Nocardioides sp. zg-1308]NPD05657.1 alpha/beta hydrolase [Nocardioides sp. zg-1308]